MGRNVEKTILKKKNQTGTIKYLPFEVAVGMSFPAMTEI